MPKRKLATGLPTRTRDKVAIVGFTQHGVEAPWKDESWDLMGLNDLHSMFESMNPGIFQTDRVQWFQLHHRDATGQYPGARDPVHTEWLTKQTCPVWMWAHDPAIPASRPYPIRDVLASPRLAGGKPLSPEAYFNNTISWMIALAIVQGYKTIGVFGVDMALDGVHGESEYSWQRPSVEYFIGLARGLGIEVILPATSEICKSGYLYGWDNSSWIRRKYIDRLAALEQSEQANVAEYEHFKRETFELKGQLWGLDQVSVLLNTLKKDAPQVLELPSVAALVKEHDKRMTEGPNNSQAAANELEAAKRRLHETRGALNDIKWSLRNYLPGDGPLQDVERGPRSVVLEPPPVVNPTDLGKSDGQVKARNRLAGILT